MVTKELLAKRAIVSASKETKGPEVPQDKMAHLVPLDSMETLDPQDPLVPEEKQEPMDYR